ncbi:hypothetical protein D1AOALGA4SA_11328 [Olavius algarvensis Delta 1 endosymbiont]|nr:hypothetical protein D1AOALGA4SA_11328 [Olavius algarvensis Delta 1 endosymbiont]
MGKEIKRLILFSFAAITTFIAKAFFFFPIPQRGIVGQGLYRFINEWQFYETIAFTFIVIFLIGYFLFKISFFWSLSLGVAFSFINFGLMIIDTGIQQYTPWIEETIESTYGPRPIIFRNYNQKKGYSVTGSVTLI